MSEKLKKIAEEYLKRLEYPEFILYENLTGIVVSSCTLPHVYDMIRRPSIELQKMMVIESGYSIATIISCPDWKNFDEEFEKEILDYLMIKDILE